MTVTPPQGADSTRTPLSGGAQAVLIATSVVGGLALLLTGVSAAASVKRPEFVGDS